MCSRGIDNLQGDAMPRVRHRVGLFAVLAGVLCAVVFMTASNASATDGFSLADAGESGALNIGESQVEVSRVQSETLDKEVIRLDYTIPQGAAAGLWTKAYPEELNRDAVGMVRVRAKTADAEQAEQIRVKAEIKGTNDVQVVQAELVDGWSQSEAAVEWDRIGELTEVVFVVESTGVVDPTVGTLELACEFEEGVAAVEAAVEPGPFVYLRFGFVFAASVLVAVFVLNLHLVARMLLRMRPGGATASDVSTHATSASKSAPGVLQAFPRDLAFGGAVVLMAVAMCGIQWIAGQDGPEVHHVYLIALVGGLIGEFWKLWATGKHLTAGEAFRDVLATGLLVASVNNQPMWQAPSTWEDFLLLGPVGAATFCMIYHGANAYVLHTTKKHLSAIGAGIAVAIPYAFGLLLALQTTNITHGLADIVSFDALVDSPMLQGIVGGALLLFAFSECLVNAFSLRTKRRLLASPLAHAYLLLFSLMAMVAPRIADLGSGAASIPAWTQPLATLAATVLSQGGLWALVFMLTGVILDGMRGETPSAGSIFGHAVKGFKNAVMFSGVFMGIILAVDGIVGSEVARTIFQYVPWLVLGVAGALAGPLVKTIIESFDGSHSFLSRAAKAYTSPVLYVRGAVLGLGASFALYCNFFALPTAQRILFGGVLGAFAYGGVSVFRDSILSSNAKGSVKPWRGYFVEALLGGFIGGGIGFYLDTAQVPVVIQRFYQYAAYGQDPTGDEFRPLLSTWGLIVLEPYTGGAKLLFNEALKGVIGWGVAAWLFAVNRSFLLALFQRDTAPIRRIFSRDGATELTEGTIRVLRWGLWMAPIIFTFLRQMPNPTWYNQDGAIHTVFCMFNGVTMSPDAFNTWSLRVFSWVLVYDAFRILIWLDHMGLRVATLVNLSFLGMDSLDDKAARFIGRSATARCIPEGVKRFTTWAPLLIPFYIPVGQEWDWAWGQYETNQQSSFGAMLEWMFGSAPPEAYDGLLPWLASFGFAQLTAIGVGAAFAVACVSLACRVWRKRSVGRRRREHVLASGRYAVAASDSGEINSRLVREGYDVTRRAYEGIDPAGRALFLVDCSDDARKAWPVVGNYPEELFAKTTIESDAAEMRLVNVSNDIRTTVTITLPSKDDAVELWNITLENMSDAPRQLKAVPYLEWVLNAPHADRGHTQYNRLFPEMSYHADSNAVLALHRYTKKLGVLAASKTPEGYLTSRMDFIGRAGTVWSPRCLETLGFLPPADADAYPTFDPISSLLVDVSLKARETTTLQLVVGCADDEEEANACIERHLKPTTTDTPATREAEPRRPLIGHGEILPGTPQPYYEYADDGRTLRVLTPYTPRPYDHLMSNALGHVLCVTNRGLHTSASVNAQQNRLTTDWADTVTRELPAEAFYLYDANDQQWFSPTYLPLRDKEAKYDVALSVDGTATFHMKRGNIATELTTYVPPDDPTGVYLLTVTNNGDSDKQLRFAPCFHIALADNPENAGALKVEHDHAGGALFFENPRNTFRSGPAFAAMSEPSEAVETVRGKFYGKGRSVAHPMFVEQGGSVQEETDDQQAVAAMLATLNIPAGESRTVAVLLGQADDRKQAEAVIAKFNKVERATAHLEETRRWWNDLMATLQVETSDAEFDGYLQWMKYQTLAERVWARKGFYQASGAFGFRDQLQDTVNMIWVDPALARRQILLHAAQQFVEGDVVHWFFQLQDGRTGFACRSHAYDNLLWLGWATGEYVRMTGDTAILEERISYLTAETPLPPLPEGKHGMGFFPHRSPLEEPLLDHVLRAIDLVFNKRLGANGLPLIGAGDWNDGLDEIGSEGRGESVWLGFFLHYILGNILPHIETKHGTVRAHYYAGKREQLGQALEGVWRGDRYLRAIHDDGTEIGIEGSGIWEIDALTAAWAVMADVNSDRARTVFDTAIRVLERDNVILLGWPALREDSKPYLGRSCRYPEGVRENGMYSHGVQWLIRAARLLSERFAAAGDQETAKYYRDTTIRLWRKISAISHMTPDEIEVYGGQPNKQAADMLTTFDQGRMIWNGYTGAAGWMLRQACEGVVGAQLFGNAVTLPEDLDVPRGDLVVRTVRRDPGDSPLPS